jgi:chromosome segregation ATPase
VDNQVQGVLGKKEEDLDAYRKQVLDLERSIKVKDDKIAELELRVGDLSREVQEKEMELDFYSANH